MPPDPCLEALSSRDFFSVAGLLELALLHRFDSHKEINFAKNSVLKELGSGFFSWSPDKNASQLTLWFQPCETTQLSHRQSPHPQELWGNKCVLLKAVKIMLICYAAQNTNTLMSILLLPQPGMHVSRLLLHWSRITFLPSRLCNFRFSFIGSWTKPYLIHGVMRTDLWKMNHLRLILKSGYNFRW